MNFISETIQAAAARFEPVRLPFNLPGFTRVSWVSNRTREVWEERLRRAARAWRTIEFESVRQGLRAAGLFAMRPDDVARREVETRESGLAIRKIAQARPENSDSVLAIDAKEADPTWFRVAIGQREAVERIRLAYSDGDVVTVGTALGYPACCCRMFQQWCVQSGYRDTTWPMAATSHAHASEDFRDLHCEGPPHTNTLWRSLGIRAAPHLPCGFDCADTVALARAYLELGPSLGLAKEIEDLVAVLSWPIEWSSLHGIAEIKTPILKLITTTDPFAYKHTVRRGGDSYPFEGPVGLNFPYHRPKKNKLSSSAAFRRGLAHEVASNETTPEKG
jgi:hypothetical protein